MNEKKILREIAAEIDMFDEMLTSLVELLEEKGILTQNEWEKRIKRKISKKKTATNYRKIQFGNEDSP